MARRQGNDGKDTKRWPCAGEVYGSVLLARASELGGDDRWGGQGLVVDGQEENDLHATNWWAKRSRRA